MGGIVKSVGGLLGDLTGANAQAQAAQNAANTQAGMSQAALDQQWKMWQQQQQNIQPWMQGGQQGLNAYLSLSGANGPQAQQQFLSQIQNGPEYNAMLNAGSKNILANAAATGGLRSGNANLALAGLGSNIMGQLVGENLQRYGNLSNSGLGAVTNTGALGQGYANSMANLMSQQGAALAGGQIAQGNAAASNAQSLLGLGGMVFGGGNMAGLGNFIANGVGGGIF
jgi:hypothetical protein